MDLENQKEKVKKDIGRKEGITAATISQELICRYKLIMRIPQNKISEKMVTKLIGS